MEQIAKHVEKALEALTTPRVPSPLSIEVESCKWDFAPLPVDTREEIGIQDNMLSEAKQFLSDMIAGKEPRWLVYLGNPGCGKTHLSGKIRDFLLDKAREIYNTVERPRRDPELSNYLTCWTYAQSGSIFTKWDNIIKNAKIGDYDRLRNAESDWVKIIDDLGVNSFSDSGREREPMATTFSVQCIGGLIDARLRKWTVITANFSRSQFATQFDTRIASRFMRDNNVVVECFGLRDYGLRKEELTKQAA